MQSRALPRVGARGAQQRRAAARAVHALRARMGRAGVAEAARELERRLRAAGSRTRVAAGAGVDQPARSRPAGGLRDGGNQRCRRAASTLAAAAAGKRLLLANKESAVMAGALLMSAVRAGGGELIPIDSEHNAIFQCLPPGFRPGEAPAGVRRLLLTASGGPFLNWSAEALSNVTPAQACAHPRWSMGRKISVDSATLMNKGLELIEASVLFGMPVERHRGRGASAEHRAFAGRVRGWLGAGAAVRPGHARADRAGAGFPAAHAGRCRIPGSGAGRAAGFPRPRSASAFPACGTLGRRPASAACIAPA